MLKLKVKLLAIRLFMTVFVGTTLWFFCCMDWEQNLHSWYMILLSTVGGIAVMRRLLDWHSAAKDALDRETQARRRVPVPKINRR